MGEIEFKLNELIGEIDEWQKKYKENYIPNPNNRMREDWLDITYPKIFQNKIVWYLWKNIFCPMGWHLFDELQSVNDHYLSCDACDLEINISKDNLPIFKDDE